MKIATPEIISAMESENIGRLTAMWTAVAFERAQGDADHARELCAEFGCTAGYDAVMRHVESLPPSQRGFVHA